MATIPANMSCELNLTSASLRFPPPSGGQLASAVHAGALKAKGNGLNQLILLKNEAIVWAGALDEMHISSNDASAIDSRSIIRKCITNGRTDFAFIVPGILQNGTPNRKDTTYRGSRPWLVIAENDDVGYLAVPLNDADGVNKWWEHPLPAESLPVEHPKDSKLGLNHLWSFPKNTSVIGYLRQDFQQSTLNAVVKYYT